jgi:hypothetical protein
MPMEMKRRHLLHILFLHALALLSLAFHRHLSLPLGSPRLTDG